MASAQVCPVVGTTNSTLPPSHPDVDLSQPGAQCPVVGARTEHHRHLAKHPSVASATAAAPSAPTTQSAGSSDAQICPALRTLVESDPRSRAMDDKVCPVVGPVTTVLPPDHPPTDGRADADACPVTKARVGHHKDKVVVHPKVEDAGAVCPVTGAGAAK
ncbi:hypothetical protein SLS62_011107 [Diatrype stigma]|uniref:5-aminolevulinate synthase presequence domain-containing protein n=1 Tax=Diatrype stigma TaxID=117547 RepID=A0AAN9YF47_9PEZI